MGEPIPEIEGFHRSGSSVLQRSNSSFSDEEDTKAVKKFLAKANKILAAIDAASVSPYAQHKQRIVPSFNLSEVTISTLLGTGGFGSVYEIDSFGGQDGKNGGITTNITTKPFLRTGPTRIQSEPYKVTKADTEKPKRSNTITITESYDTDDSDDDECDEDDDIFNENMNNPGTLKTIHGQNQIRAKMKKHPRRNNGDSRFVLKCLKDDLTALEQARGMVDLAIETKFLTIVHHPNIIKLRGIARGNLVDKDFFLILDRVYSTLDQEIPKWKTLKQQYSGKCLGLVGRDSKALQDLLIKRMGIAYDLSSAYNYLHENKMVYRDIKPENIGFDAQGEVKIFDFGLCKILSDNIKATPAYGYNLTGRVGSFPYMAPEVVQLKSYDTKCDVFSFAILLWEMLSLKAAFAGISTRYFVEKVVLQKKRPIVNSRWPLLTRMVLLDAWDDNPKSRPDMKRMAVLIRGDLNMLTDDDFFLRRTMRMTQRSSEFSDIGDE